MLIGPVATTDVRTTSIFVVHRRRGIVDVVFVSLQRRNDDDVVNGSSSRRYNDVETKSSSSRRGSRQRHRHDDDVVPRRRVVDNGVDATTKTSTTRLSLSRNDDDIRTFSTSLQRRDNGVSVVVSASMSS